MAEDQRENGVPLTGTVFDQDLYGGSDRSGLNRSAYAVDDEDPDDQLDELQRRQMAARAAHHEIPEPDATQDDMMPGLGFQKPSTIYEREDDYRRRRLNRIISPDRNDAFAMGDKTPDARVRSYADIMREQQLQREMDNTMQNIVEKKRREAELAAASQAAQTAAPAAAPQAAPAEKKRRRWDSQEGGEAAAAPTSEWDQVEATPAVGSRWDATPGVGGAAAPTPGRRNRWDDATPKLGGNATPGWGGETPSAQADGGAKKPRSRWDETPANLGPGATPMVGQGITPSFFTGATPAATAGMETPAAAALQRIQAQVPMTPEQYQEMRTQREMYERNKPLTDEELDSMLPGEKEGYKIMAPPANYKPVIDPAKKLMATPTPMMTPFYAIPEENNQLKKDMPVAPEGLPEMKPEDMQYFAKLLQDVDEAELSIEEAKERKIMKLLLKVKNGTPPQRKAALRQLTDKARDFGAGPLFNQILPLLMQPTLEDQERHLLVKVIDRILYKLDELVRPYVHKILVVIEPLLIDEDYYARVEGREIIANLSKAAGLAQMIAAMRPDIDNIDEYVRNTTARAFSVVASALGIPALLPFLKAVCLSKKSWQARHTGIKIVQQIAILMGCAVLPHLKSMVDIIKHGLKDENQKVKTITALSLAALAEAATPYGIESFDDVLEPLWRGIRALRGKVLAAFLKAIGHIIPLMDAEHAFYYTREVMIVLKREFSTPDEEMKKIVLKVVKQCVDTEGVESEYIKTEILPEFFKAFWNRRMALDRRNYRALVETTVSLADKVGCSEIVGRVVEDLKDESEPYRRMVMETIEKVVSNLGSSDIDARLEELLIDGILYAFQEQVGDDAHVMLNGFGTVVNSLGKRAKPYLPQVCGTIKWRLNNKSAKIRQQAADLIARIAPVMKACEEEQLLGHLGVVLYEYLGEEYPEVLGSILGALKGIVNVIGMTRMTPPIKELLPRLTPILKNRHEKVQENCIDLVGRIADRGASYVPAREWMRICFELLDMLKAHKKAIRRASVNTFGYIAKAIGPQDVLVTLLNNLKVQERQNRVCTTVAIAIVAETCAPFTVLPALMNEYRTPELNVQNGVLKALSFMFEYIGEMGKDYIYAVSPLLEDALMDRDLVHRQTAARVVEHISLGVAGLGCEDALVHLLNYVWPNIFEVSPHVVAAVSGAIDGCRLALGPCAILHYTLQGLWHPARKVREVYWRIYNNLYIGAQDAMVAFLPRIEDDAHNTYARHELDLLI
uniref:TOG domain-containing protein n=1 Tax=Chlamydomonas leiostraca TaxID=1034604 RepID=A0A7S0WT61_9CHLO|mmetsp:Transcript_27526/g.70082  ORF Transcript_27526/g.70082 Transcript_27526/m.70082 type:complete len:1247 (+) Transcript_27526:88-3828(+)|eukprot:CAMPEP_0202869112 /NCGR_PEP_ID=MMETSP1391-20130828/11889_1 /ASSEMBLY_ACC=CAM_ASM_000867 /TAXON_ID=1034604 /ORGANISM="Chlamydomonas leiostraca, Strain SAG 11-49" /LENGTH=1246 /DNA_ID=CAMNT_0049549375 /DNA_START=84 /DNA_END=3824 /DNA_ORIENTATION=+